MSKFLSNKINKITSQIIFEANTLSKITFLAKSINSLKPFLFELLCVFFLGKLRNLFPFKPFGNFLTKSLYSSTEQVDIFEALFCKIVGILDALLLIEVVNDYDFVLLILVVVHLGEELVPVDVGPWEAEGLFDVILLVLLGLSHVQKQELGFDADRKLFGLYGDGGQVTGLTSGVFLGLPLVPVVN